MAMTRAGQVALDLLRIEDPQRELPWGGRSPRALTDAFKRFSLRHEDDQGEPTDVSDAMIEEQCRRHFHGS